MKKKVFTLMLVMALVFGTSTISAFAAGDELSEETNTVSTEQKNSTEGAEPQNPTNEEISTQTDEIASGTCGENLMWVLTSDGTLTIAGEGEMITDSDISIAEGIPWYEYAESVQRVVIGDRITSVGNYAFTSCINLKEAVLPDSIQRIGDRAFYSCRGLESIILPESLISIGEYAFASCGSLAEIEIPDSVTDIGDFTFDQCHGLQKITLPDNITDIKMVCLAVVLN